MARKERDRLRISRIDIAASPEWAERFGIEQAPVLVLIKDRRPVAQLEGRVSAPQIERMLESHLETVSPAAA